MITEVEKIVGLAEHKVPEASQSEIRLAIKECKEAFELARPGYMDVDAQSAPALLGAVHDCERAIEKVNGLATSLKKHQNGLPYDKKRAALKVIAGILGVIALAVAAVFLSPVAVAAGGVALAAIPVALAVKAVGVGVAGGAGALGGIVTGKALIDNIRRDFERMHDRVAASKNAAIEDLAKARMKTIETFAHLEDDSRKSVIESLETAAKTESNPQTKDRYEKFLEEIKAAVTKKNARLLRSGPLRRSPPSSVPAQPSPSAVQPPPNGATPENKVVSGPSGAPPAAQPSRESNPDSNGTEPSPDGADEKPAPEKPVTLPPEQFDRTLPPAPPVGFPE